MKDLGFVHKFIPSGHYNGDVILLMLHGTGGNEDDLLPLGPDLLPGAALLSPRRKVLENGMPRYFRRFAEGRFDVEDLKSRANELAEFIDSARSAYDLEDKKFIAVGYSNGANIAAGLMLLQPHILAGAVLLRAMVPFRPQQLPALEGKPVLLAAGLKDHIAPAVNTQELAVLLRGAQADVTMHWHPGGHELGADDLQAAKSWLSRTGI